jgi:uroporphyrinogen-III synthase
MTRILVTRPAGQAGELVALLAAAGIEAETVPTVAIETGARDALLRALEPGVDWLVITSANGAAALDEVQLPLGTRVAAVGPATAGALRARGVPVAHVPDRFLTAAIADGLGDLHGRRVVLARAQAAAPALREALLARGAAVEEVVTYRAIEGPPQSEDALRAAVRRVDGVAFTSGSTVRGFVRLLAADGLQRASRLPAFCIGPVTAEVADAAGLTVAGIAREHTAVGLARVIVDHYRAQRG